LPKGVTLNLIQEIRSQILHLHFLLEKKAKNNKKRKQNREH